jgi:aryl carrier-like protein
MVNAADPTSQLAAWMAGDTVDWAIRRARHPARRIPLPGSVLRPVRCWIDEAGDGEASAPAVRLTPPPPSPSPPQDGARPPVLSILAEYCSLRPQDLTPETHLEADLGLDSIRLMGLAARLVAAGIDIPMAKLAQARQVGDLAALAGASPAQPAPQPAPPRTETEPRAIPLLDAQMLFLLGHHLIDSSSLCSWVRLGGPFDLELGRRAWQVLVDSASPGRRGESGWATSAPCCGRREAGRSPRWNSTTFRRMPAGKPGFRPSSTPSSTGNGIWWGGPFTGSRCFAWERTTTSWPSPTNI